jgi:hypothetical protein
VKRADLVTKEDLKELIVALTEASRKPPEPTEDEAAQIAQRKAQIQAAQEERKANGEAHLEGLRNKQYYQQQCSHMHSQLPGGLGGGTRMVHIHDNGVGDGRPGYLYCQKCELRIRPESGPLWHKLDPTAVFDTEKFNWYYQSTTGGRGGVID